MKKFIAQPYWAGSKVRIYNTSSPSAAAPDFVLDTTINGGHHPNGVLIHKNKIFVALGEGVFIYHFANIFINASASPAVKIVAKDVVGMAIDPATDDLYFTLYNEAGNNNADSGVYKTTALSGYKTTTQFSSFADASVAQHCGNLAFKDGHLWMTTFDGAGHFLICYKNINKLTFYKITNSTKTFKAVNLNGSPDKNVYLLSGPEGIAFDATGNLWLANNNDDIAANDPGDGTLVKIFASTINAILATTANGSIYNIAENQVSIVNINGGKLGGLTFDDDFIYINDQGTNQGSANVDDFTTAGQVWKWDIKTAFNSTNLKASGVHTTYPGNGTSALNDIIDLFIEDTSYITGIIDTGVEPDTVTQHAWESKEIWMTNTASGTTNEAVKGKTSCFVRVRIKNRGLGNSLSTEEITLYWAKASSSLGWPTPWTNNDKYGATVGTQNIPVISANNDTIVTFPFTTPDPKDYEVEFGNVNDHHFCLLARISNVGMSFPEQTGSPAALMNNVLNNNNIAWRNIGIDDAVSDGGIVPFKFHGIIATNYSKEKINGRIVFEVLNAKGKQIKNTAGKIIINLLPKSLEVLRKAQFNKDNFEQVETRSATRIVTGASSNSISLLVKNWKDGLSDFLLEPQEEFYLGVQFIADKPIDGYTLRAIQYAQRNKKNEIIGGQTFIQGKVKHFDSKPTNKKETCNSATILSYLFKFICAFICCFIVVKTVSSAKDKRKQGRKNFE